MGLGVPDGPLQRQTDTKQAAPLVSRYAAWYQATAEKSPPVMESQSAHEHRARGSAAVRSS